MITSNHRQSALIFKSLCIVAAQLRGLMKFVRDCGFTSEASDLDAIAAELLEIAREFKPTGENDTLLMPRRTRQQNLMISDALCQVASQLAFNAAVIQPYDTSAGAKALEAEAAELMKLAREFMIWQTVPSN